jgi:hypothetical protein
MVFGGSAMSSVNSSRLTYRCGSALRDTSQTPREVLYSKLSLPRKERQTAAAVRKGIPHKHVHAYLSPLLSIEATRVCITIGKSEVLLPAVCKSPGHARNNAVISELLSFIRT